jgi:putative mRNA 3-end processing factor
MSVRQRARQRGVEVPLVISDHCDWDELCHTIREVAPEEVWVTHGREEALVRWCELMGLPAKPLHLMGYEEEPE